MSEGGREEVREGGRAPHLLCCTSPLILDVELFSFSLARSDSSNSSRKPCQRGDQKGSQWRALEGWLYCELREAQPIGFGLSVFPFCFR